jgi:hypothetical protein
MSAYFVDTATITVMLAAGIGHTEPGLIGNTMTSELSWWTTSMQRVREQLNGGDRYDQFRRKLGYDNATEVGQMLLIENVRSLNYRYDLDHDGEEKAKELIDYTLQVDEYVYPPGGWIYRLTASDVFGCISNYEYQACEHPEWEDSEAHSFCLNLQHRLLRGLCKDAPWGMTHDDLDAKRTGARTLSAAFDTRGNR